MNDSTAAKSTVGLVEEDGSDRAALVWDRADGLNSAALVSVEAQAALAAAVRGHRLTPPQHRQSQTRPRRLGRRAQQRDLGTYNDPPYLYNARQITLRTGTSRYS